MSKRPSFFLRQNDEDVWEFIAEGEIHSGYPDVLQCCAAAMRFFDPNIERSSINMQDLVDMVVDERRSRIHIVKTDLEKRENLNEPISTEIPTIES